MRRMEAARRESNRLKQLKMAARSAETETSASIEVISTTNENFEEPPTKISKNLPMSVF
jgi:hypothetical protein